MVIDALANLNYYLNNQIVRLNNYSLIRTIFSGFVNLLLKSNIHRFQEIE